MMVNAGFNRNINYDIILDLLKMIWLFFSQRNIHYWGIDQYFFWGGGFFKQIQVVSEFRLISRREHLQETSINLTLWLFNIAMV